MLEQLERSPYYTRNHVSSPIQLGEGVTILSGQKQHTDTATVTRIGRVFFDTGSEANFDYLRNSLERSDMPLNQEFAVFLTHGHVDHIGATSHLVNYIRRHKGEVTVYASKKTAECVAEGSRFQTAAYLYSGVNPTKVPIDTIITEGDEREIGDVRVRVVSTPGHSPDGTSYVVNDTILIVGDSTIGAIIDEINMGSNFDQFKETQAKIRDLLICRNAPKYSIEGHGHPEHFLPTSVLLARIAAAPQTRAQLLSGFHNLPST